MVKLRQRLVNKFYHLPQAVVANLLYGFPGKQLQVIGVTGTDGKTTTVNLIAHLLREAKLPVSLISTVNAIIGDRSTETGLHVTSPNPWLLQRLLRQAVATGTRYFVLEVTSHALDQHRVWGVPFLVGVYTNISQDHLDYHGSVASYLAAKSKLARLSSVVVVNADDQNALSALAQARTKKKMAVTSYGIESQADFRAIDIQLSGQKTSFSLCRHNQTLPVTLPLPGRYNIENGLAALAVAVGLGVPLTQAINSLESFKPVPGRLELIDYGQPFQLIIDFAHTPKALESVLSNIKAVFPRKRLITVFGCAGERDPGRRQMGMVSARLADVTIITAEDPRTEGVGKISGEIARWAEKGGGVEIKVRELRDGGFSKSKHYFILVPDRREAIQLAVEIAQEEDLVLVTGKGHEKSMCFGREEMPWSDQQVVRELLTERFQHH